MLDYSRRLETDCYSQKTMFIWVMEKDLRLAVLCFTITLIS